MSDGKMANYNLARHLEEAFNFIGASMMKDDFALKLLAFVHSINTELVVYHQGLNAGIAIAQQKFNFYGGEVPTLTPQQNKDLFCYIQESWYCQFETPWLEEIYDRYQLDKTPLKWRNLEEEALKEYSQRKEANRAPLLFQ